MSEVQVSKELYDKHMGEKGHCNFKQNLTNE